MKSKTNPAMGGGASASKKLMAAIAVLAVVFAATAVVLVSDDVSADTTKTEKIGEYEVVFENSMDATIVGDKITFSGYATAATVSGDASSYSGLFNQGDRLNKDVLDSYSAIYVKALSSCKIKQTNNALAEYDGQNGIVHDAVTGAWTKTSETARDYTSGYAFLIPKDNSDVTIEILDSNNKVLKKLTFDFDQVSTKIVLGSKAIKSDMGTTPVWKYETGSGTLTFTNYSGKEIFRTTGNLKIVLNGTNTISAYGAVNNYEGSAIYAGVALAISANDSADASLNVTQNTAGAYGIVSYSGTMTIGSITENVKEVTLTVDGKPNRAIYAVSGLEVNNAKIVAQSTEKTIRSNGAMAIGVKADVTANLLSLSGNSQGDDDYMGIKGASLTIGAGSIVTTQGLCLTGDKPFGDTTSSAIAGKVIVSGDYVQNPKTDVKPVIAGLYLKAAVTGVEATRAVPAADAVAGVYLINGAEAYNIVVKSVDGKTTEKTDAITAAPTENPFSGDVAKQTYVISSANTELGDKVDVTSGKELVITTTGDGSVKGIIKTGGNQSITLDGVKGTLVITKGSIELTDADVSAGSITLNNTDNKAEVVVKNDATLSNFTFKAGTGSKDMSVTIPAGVTVKATGLTIEEKITTYVSGKITGTVVNNGKLVLLAGGDISKATITGAGFVVNGGEDSTYSTIDVNGEIKTPSFGPEQLVRINGEATVANSVIFNGKLIIPEGSKLTVKAGATVIMDNLAILQVDGDLIVEGADGTTPAGKVVLNTGSMVVNANIAIDGELQVKKNGSIAGSVTVSKDSVLTMNAESVLDTVDGTSITVKASGALEILGAFDGVTISNSGNVTIDSSYAATAQSTIKLKADGAVLEVKKYTVAADMAGNAKIVVNDDGNTLATYKDGGKTNYVKLKDQTASVEISASGITSSDYTMSVSGITVTEVVSSEAIDTFPNTPANAAAGKYNNKQMSQTLDVDGSVDVSYAYVGSTTAAEQTAKAKVAFASSGENKSIAVTGSVVLGKNVELSNASVLKVSGKIVAPSSKADAGFHGAAGSVTVTGDGEVSTSGDDKFNNESTINATRYMTEAVGSDNKKVKTYHYIALDAALAMVNADGNAVKEITAIGKQTIEVNGKLPASVTLLQNSDATITVGAKSGDDVTLTIAKGAVFKNNGAVIVNGILFAENKSDVKTPANIKSDVYSEQTENGVTVKNGWAKWTNLVTAVNGASSGETITLSNTEIIEINNNMTVRDGVTLMLPDGTEGIVLADGVTLTIEGTVIVSSDANIKAKTGFDLTASKVVSETAGKYSSSVVVTGKLMTETQVKYNDGITATSSGSSTAVLAGATDAGAPIAGAYYQTDDYYVIASLEKALADAGKIIISDITIHGKVVAGDIVAKGTDTLKNVKVAADVTKYGMTGASTGGTLIGTTLTVGSMTLDGMSLVVDRTLNTTSGSEANPAYFTGTVVIGDASVAFKNATGSTTAMVSADSEGKYVLGAVNLNNKGDSMTVSAGTVYIGGNATIASANTTGSIKVAAGATLVAKDAAIYTKLTVDGTLSVPENKALIVSGTLQVNGTVKVDAATSTSAAGSLTVGPTTGGSTGKLFIGISSSDYKSTGAVASFNGPVAMYGQIIVSSDAVVDDAFKAVLDEIEKKTTFNVNGSAWFTAYFKGTASTTASSAGTSSTDVTTYYDTIAVNKIPVDNVKLTGWAKTEGGAIITKTNSTEMETTFTIGVNKNLYAAIDTQVYKVVIKADEGIADVYLNGQAMAYGLVKSGDDFYYAYSSTVAAGDYKVTYTLKNGWSGDAKLAGDNVSGMSFKVSGDYSKESVYQLTGVEKSGYVEPVTPSEDKSDDGLTVTDYLLIVLVVLIVILAVIVAMRLMRS